MVYTSYDMVRDCRAGKPEGWTYFVANYLPVIRKLLAHYAPAPGPSLEGVLKGLHNPASSLFASLDPAPERWVVAEMRQKVLAGLPLPEASAGVDLEQVSGALAPLTLLEKQVSWFETMRYGPPESGTMLRMSGPTVTKIRERASELLRGAVDTWNRNLLAENGLALGRAAAAAETPDCVSSKTFLDVLDGRSTWRNREEMERHVTECWHCIDHFCRMAEVIELLRGVQPIEGAELGPYLRLLGLPDAKAGGWKKWFGGAR